LKVSKLFSICPSIFGIGFVAFLFLSACNSSKKSDENVTFFSEKDYSELFLDSNTLKSFISSDSEYVAIQDSVRLFYQNRLWQFAWISEGKLSQAGHHFYNQLLNYKDTYHDSSLIDRKLDSLLIESEEDEEAFFRRKPSVEKLEMLLTSTFFRYAQKEFTGKAKNLEQLKWFIPRKKKNLRNLLDSLLVSTDGIRLAEPNNPYYQSLKNALKQYRNLQKTVKWPNIPFPSQSLKPGDQDSAIPAIKKTLFLYQDWQENDTSLVFSPTLDSALQHFQKRMGLPETGLPNEATLNEMRVSVDDRIRQIMLNLERIRWLPDTVSGDFILVNIPEFKMHVFQSGKQIWESNAVVGKDAGRTQIFRGNMSQIILNPSWGVPPGIVRKEVLPGIKKNISYLRKHQMDVYSGNTKVDPHKINWQQYSNRIPFTIRQRKGEENPLGKFKFMFPNSYWIYLHDSNEKYLFGASKRAFSHGCIRVEKAQELAEYLLKKNNNWSPEKIEKEFKTTREAGLNLIKKEPVFIIYLTAWVNAEGTLNFRKDIYQLDPILGKELFGEE